MRRRLNNFWTEYRTLVYFLMVMVLFRSAVADWNQVPTGSMKPTILEGDRVVVNKLAYDLKVPFTSWEVGRWADPSRGEIVTFYSPADGRLLIKRVIGTPGDVVEMRDNQLFINEEPANYDELNQAIVHQLDLYEQHNHEFFEEQVGGKRYPVMLIPSYNQYGPVKIPDEAFLMLGDNRNRSEDSRVIGLVPRELITGRAHTVAFSVDYDSYYLPRMDRFIHPLNYE